jgi:hypothetical protein
VLLLSALERADVMPGRLSVPPPRQPPPFVAAPLAASAVRPKCEPGDEITAPKAVPLERLNQLLADLGEPPLAEQDYKPARAA